MDNDDSRKIEELLRSSQTVAVLGATSRKGRPARYVPDYLSRNGYRVLPVNPSHIGESMWDGPFLETLTQVSEPVDIVDIFRRPEAIPGHLDDILAMRPLPRCVWLQLGIRHDDAARQLEKEGIEVVQDRCILIEHRALD